MKKDNTQYRILVIEDNPGDFTMVEDFLMEEILAPEIVHAVSFNRASEILSASGIAFDIILLDLSLPDKTGQELITEMLKLSSSCPLIILTGYTDIGFSLKSIAQGVVDYLLKDELNANLLYKSIIYSIERKKVISELQRSEQRYSDLFNLSPLPKWIFDPATLAFFQVNKAARDLYGYSEAEYFNMKVTDIIVGPAERIYDRISRHYKKSGEGRDVEMYFTPIIISNKELCAVVAIDVTERNLFEQKITKAIIQTQEDERYEMGAELHDNVCQILGAGKLNLAMLKSSLPAASLGYYDECRENILLALDEIRNLSHRLAPAFFEDSSLEESFRRLFQSFTIGGETEILLHFDEAVHKYALGRELQLNLYRILQEQLKNILKYAGARSVEVDVIVYHNHLMMKISDNGVGFNTETVKGGIGMANMKRRTELFSGKFEIDSSPGNGCTIMIEIPLDKTEVLNKAAV